jgi:ABC-type nickel/cobalt efflux system permease component RcnA
MDKALAFGAIVTLLAFWMIYREHRKQRGDLSSYKTRPDERDATSTFKRIMNP